MESKLSKEKFADLSLKNWPLAVVKFNELESNEDFDFFLQRWENLGKAKQDYSIILDTRNFSNVGINNAFSGMKFVARLREEKPQYLKNVVLIYNRSYLYYLFNLVLSFQKPVAKTYTYFTEDMGTIDYMDLFESRDMRPDKFVITEPE